MTSEPTPLAFPDQIGRSAQIIVGGLMAGLIVFGTIAYTIAQRKGNEPTILSWFAFGFFLVMILISVFLSRTTTQHSIRRIAAANPSDWRAALAPLYASRTILSNAPLEGAGFFNCTAFMIEGHWMSAVIVFAILSLMAITFPSQFKFESWAEQVQRANS
jgi:hypothetical protein